MSNINCRKFPENKHSASKGNTAAVRGNAFAKGGGQALRYIARGVLREKRVLERAEGIYAGSAHEKDRRHWGMEADQVYSSRKHGILLKRGARGILMHWGELRAVVNATRTAGQPVHPGSTKTTAVEEKGVLLGEAVWRLFYQNQYPAQESWGGDPLSQTMREGVDTWEKDLKNAQRKKTTC